MNFIRNYPILSFFLLALALGSGTITLVFLGVIPTAFALSSVLSASIAGIIMTALLDGKTGLKNLLKRVLIWRVGIGYWLFALLFLPPVILLGSTLNRFLNADPGSIRELRLTFGILPMLVAFFIVAGLGQELGWSGFLLPRLQARFSAFVSSLVRALLVVLWHLPLLIYSRFQPQAIPDFPYGAWILQAGFPATLFAILLLSLPWSILYTWLFNNTRGSLLLVATLHGSEIWLAYLFTGLGISPYDLDNYRGYGILLFVTALIILFATGPQNLSVTGKRVAHPSGY